MQRPDLTIFQDGTTARASGFNDNFDALADYIQGSVSEMNTTVANTISSLQTLVNSSAPTGVVQAYSGNNAPSGWLICDGSTVGRAQYAALFNVIGTTFGAGNGSTTFNLPNLVGRFIEGSNTVGTVKEAGLPNLTCNFSIGSQARTHLSTNLIRYTGQVSGEAGGSGGNDDGVTFDASAYNPIYGRSTTVQPPSVTMKYIIKT